MRGLMQQLGLEEHPRVVDAGRAEPGPGVVLSINPAAGEPIAGVKLDGAKGLQRAIANAAEAFDQWRRVPAPLRGQLVREVADELRRFKEPLGELIALEVGKIRSEGLGEVQETIDIADFAVGLSRQLHGITMPSERPGHAMREQWLPLGPVGVITAFNFPHAVWGWNAMLAAVCGDSILWKPSLMAPLTAIATTEIARRVCERNNAPDIFGLVIGTDDVVGEPMVKDKRLPLISATGSCRMGRRVASLVGERLGRSLLELGGNNAMIVDADADMDLALRAVLFGAVGTAGQRCTTTRRLIVHESIADEFLARLAKAYAKVKIGDPLAEGVLMGPLIHEDALTAFEKAVKTATEQGGEVICGGERATVAGLNGCFVKPTIVRAPKSNDLPISLEETFAPVLYAFTFKDLEEAIALNNSANEGLSSAICTGSVRAAERFLSPDGTGSDCGLAYVNTSTSGAEIGGAFGGEKDTGGGRESGSDAWKVYMRRQTCTVNFSGAFELAQGIRFE